jgi:DNA-binding beta-propeller fold protein YncE
VDPNTGHVFVVEDLGNRVQELTPAGSPIAVWGRSGTGNGEFDGPYDLAISQWTVLVTDANNRRVQRFTPPPRAYLPLLVKTE